MFSFLRPIVLASLATPLLALAAPPEAATEHVQARLVSSHATVAPGQRFTVALEQNIKPHWHTYWQNPGDSGQATTIEWTGAEAGPIQWPTPSVQAIGPIVNYGYEGRAALLVDVTVPADAKAGSRFKPTAAVKWLVCKDVCIPEDVSLGLDLPVAAEAKPGPDAAQIDEWRGAIPKPAAFTVQIKPAAQGVTLTGTTAGVTKAYFYADTWGAVAHSAPQALKAEGGGWTLDVPAGDEPLAAGKPLSGVLVLTTGAGDQASTLSLPMPQGAGKGPGPADLSAPEGAATPAAATPAPESDLGLGAALALALVGGLILNLMPCVFPVLSIKALALVRQGNGDAHRAEGLAYTAGVLASFLALAAVLIALRAGGQQVGWGFQFHSPVFVLVVAYLLFLVGLSLSGFFEIGGSLMGMGSGLAAREGLAGSFFTGVLAAVVATPCTAPFMGAALAFALSQPAVVMVAVFLALGLGLALPFLVLAFWPAAQRWLPRPGAWMDKFKQALAFPMYAAVVWLLWVLAQQAGPDGVALALGGMVLIAFGLWWRNASGASALGTGAAVATVLLALGAAAWIKPVTTEVRAAGESAVEAFSSERLEELRGQNKPVFVNLTAAWCISCLVNERVALSRPEVHDAFAKAGVVYLKGDWTREDPKITAVLKAHGRSGVPLYLYYAPGAAEAQVLPQLLTPGLVVEAVSPPPAPRSST